MNQLQNLTREEAGLVMNAAFLVANAAVIADIESEGRSVVFEGVTWWDTTSMFHPAEHSPPVIDQFRLAMDYAIASRLVDVHPRHAYLVRINKV